MINNNGLQLIEHYESLHDGDLHVIGLQPKMDPVGIWTEGWGSAILDKNGKFVKGIANKNLAYSLSKIHTKEDADKQLLNGLQPRLHIIAQKIKVNLNDNQIAALVSFIYNTGGSPTLFNLINSKDKNLVSWWNSHYITGQGNPKPQPGLVYRRKSESLLFSTGELKFFN